MGICATCGAAVGRGDAHRPGCPSWTSEAAGGPWMAPPPPGGRSQPLPGPPTTGLGGVASGAAWLPGPPAPGTPGGPLTSSVDAFEDGLIPFLGDPTASRALGRAVQVVMGLLALYSLIRAGFWAYFSSLLDRPDVFFSPAELERVETFGQVVDTIDLLFWPTLIGALVVQALWNRKRRPRELLAQRGEAYVESTIQRAVPPVLRVGLVVLMGAGFAIGVVLTPANPGAGPWSGYATTRILTSLCFAAAWALFIPWVFASEHHLRRRIAKAADPVLAAYTVPYVEPEREQGALGQTGESSGAGWLLRTAGLLLAGLFSLLIVIGALSGLGADPLLALAWLIGAGSVLGLVVWAFVRRWRAAHPTTPVP